MRLKRVLFDYINFTSCITQNYLYKKSVLIDLFNPTREDFIE